MTDEVTEAISLIIQELRENFNSFAQDGKIAITTGLWMTPSGFQQQSGGIVIPDVAAAFEHVTLAEWSDALRRSLERRTGHSQKRVDRLTAEIKRAKRIIAVLKR